MLTFSADITLGDIIQAIAVLIAAVGLVLTAYETGRAARQRRVELIVDLQNRFHADSELMDAYSIEYAKFRYTDDFHGSKLEQKIDKLLSHFENIATLYLAGAISARELELVSYYHLAIYENAEIQRYFKTLDEWYAQWGLTERPFGLFRRVGALLERRGVRSARWSRLTAVFVSRARHGRRPARITRARSKRISA